MVSMEPPPKVVIAHRKHKLSTLKIYSIFNSLSSLKWSKSQLTFHIQWMSCILQVWPDGKSTFTTALSPFKLNHPKVMSVGKSQQSRDREGNIFSTPPITWGLFCRQLCGFRLALQVTMVTAKHKLKRKFASVYLFGAGLLLNALVFLIQH